ncbi:MAG: hypothetical protein JJU45_09250 [Acidimicrobiia bacterium]|nr:hypothetical protein [Acidimicrobiia bacterium]
MTRAALLGYGAVLVGAAVPWLEVAAVVPVGVASGLNPVVVAVVAFVGNAATLVGALALQRRATAWYRARRARRAPAAATAPGTAGVTADAGTGSPLSSGSRRSNRARRLLDRWGLPGLAALAPVSVGTHVAALVLAGSGIAPRRVAVWILGGLAVWTVALAGLAAGGVAALGLAG